MHRILALVVQVVRSLEIALVLVVLVVVVVRERYVQRVHLWFWLLLPNHGPQCLHSAPCLLASKRSPDELAQSSPVWEYGCAATYENSLPADCLPDIQDMTTVETDMLIKGTGALEPE